MKTDRTALASCLPAMLIATSLLPGPAPIAKAKPEMKELKSGELGVRRDTSRHHRDPAR